MAEMGSCTANGGLKAGEKHDSAFKTKDRSTALVVAKSKVFAKPGGLSSSLAKNYNLATVRAGLTIRSRRP